VVKLASGRREPLPLIRERPPQRRLDWGASRSALSDDKDTRRSDAAPLAPRPANNLGTPRRAGSSATAPRTAIGRLSASRLYGLARRDPIPRGISRCRVNGGRAAPFTPGHHRRAEENGNYSAARLRDNHGKLNHIMRSLQAGNLPEHIAVCAIKRRANPLKMVGGSSIGRLGQDVRKIQLVAKNLYVPGGNYPRDNRGQLRSVKIDAPDAVSVPVSGVDALINQIQAHRSRVSVRDDAAVRAIEVHAFDLRGAGYERARGEVHVALKGIDIQRAVKGGGQIKDDRQRSAC